MSEKNTFTFKTGDRVKRTKDTYMYGAPTTMLHGTIVRCYADGPRYLELYDVEWDGDGRISKGYLTHGLELDV